MAAKTAKVTLEEFQIQPHPDVVDAGAVTISADNIGTTTHEFVLVRADGVAALPRVTTPTADRIAGDVDEEAIPEKDKPGEIGDIEPGSQTTKTFHLEKGTYVAFCNIDQQTDRGVINHFQQGMHAVIIVK